MAARIVHFGGDGCNRLAVLQTAGYCVEDCATLSRLLTTLRGTGQADAVAITETWEDIGHGAVVLTRQNSPAPLILFQGPDCRCNESEFDLVIPSLTPPRFWLEKIAATIQLSREIHAASRDLGKESARLRLDSTAARKRCEDERRKLRLLCEQKPADPTNG